MEVCDFIRHNKLLAFYTVERVPEAEDVVDRACNQLVLWVDVECNHVPHVRASTLFEHKEVSTLRYLGSRDKCNSALPAWSSDPEFSLAVEKLHICNLVFNFDRLYVWIVINQSASKQIVHLDLASLESDEKELRVCVWSNELYFLLVWFGVRLILIGLCELVVSRFNEIASNASVGCAIPDPDHVIWVDSIQGKLNFVNYDADKPRGAAGQHRAIKFFSAWYLVFKRSILVGLYDVLTLT